VGGLPHHQGAQLLIAERDTRTTRTRGPHELTSMQTSRAQPKPKAVVDQDLHPTRASIGEEVGVMRPRLAEHAHHPRERRVRAGAHIKRFDCQPRRIDADHAISSRSHAAHAPAALVGHSIVIREFALRICTRIERSVVVPVIGADTPPSGTGRNPASGAGRLRGALDRGVASDTEEDRLIHVRSMFAFTCNSSATADTEAPGLPHAAIAAALNAGVCRRRRRFSMSCISVHLKLSGHYRHANNPMTVDDFASRLRNTHSMGYYTVIDRINGGDFRINCEPIITADLWKKANDSIDQEWVRRMSRPKNRTTILFRSLTYCGHCGLRFTIYDSEATTTTLYYCPHKQREYARIGKALYNKKRFTGCGMDRDIRVNVFEKVVIKLMASVMAKGDIFKARFELAVMSERTLIKSPHQLRYINQQLTELTGLRNSISELVERSERKSSQEIHEREGVAYIDHKNRVRIKELDEEIDRLKLRLDEREQYLKFSKWLVDTRAILGKFDELSHEERKKFVYEVIDGIEVRFNRKTKSHTLKVVFWKSIDWDKAN